ncbi:WD40-repeat-containing domain protein [Favolaschia claudopus]|uniref:WD40-repeat-containing domain protein n=1 Tax=Favolaschia claudopus TaxID=2862362 RepID=A0AAW0A2N8_9AGAR
MPAVPLSAFKQYKIIKSHSDSINSVAFSQDGRLLASGGDDGFLSIFQAQNWQKIRKYEVASAVRAIAWHPALQLRGKLLAIGYNAEVLIAKLSSIVKPAVWSNEVYVPSPSYNYHDDEDITRSVHFHTTDKLLLVVYLYSGIIAYDTERSAAQRWRINTERCGDSAFSPAARMIVSTNLTNGVDWYDIVEKSLSSRTAHSVSTELNIPLPVTFIGADMIAVGSAKGSVCIFKMGSVEPLQVLDHDNEMVQALVAYHYYERYNTHVLITGVSEQQEDCTIMVWVAKDRTKLFSSLKMSQSSLHAIVGLLVGINGMLVLNNGPYTNFTDLFNKSHQLLKEMPKILWRENQPLIAEPQTHFLTVTKIVEIAQMNTESQSMTITPSVTSLSTLSVTPEQISDIMADDKDARKTPPEIESVVAL